MGLNYWPPESGCCSPASLAISTGGTLNWQEEGIQMSEPNTKLDLIRLFGPVDDEWTSTTRSIRIHGKVTSIRLENFYWCVVAEIAESQSLMLPQLMTKLSKYAKNSESEHSNFTSFIRVCCVRYLDNLPSVNNDTDNVRPAGVARERRSPGTPLDTQVDSQFQVAVS